MRVYFYGNWKETGNSFRRLIDLGTHVMEKYGWLSLWGSFVVWPFVVCLEDSLVGNGI